MKCRVAGAPAPVSAPRRGRLASGRRPRPEGGAERSRPTPITRPSTQHARRGRPVARARSPVDHRARPSIDLTNRSSARTERTYENTSRTCDVLEIFASVRRSRVGRPKRMTASHIFGSGGVSAGLGHVILQPRVATLSHAHQRPARRSEKNRAEAIDLSARTDFSAGERKNAPTPTRSRPYISKRREACCINTQVVTTLLTFVIWDSVGCKFGRGGQFEFESENVAPRKLATLHQKPARQRATPRHDA